MELVFVHESGYPYLDGASEASEESHDEDEDEDEGDWGYVEFSGSDTGKCSTSRGCVIPVDGDQEKVSLTSRSCGTIANSLFFSFWTCQTLLK
jgi:hypothetical protein